jgi:hypothetical protein
MTGERIMIDPARLASGQWCHRANKTVGQGDISKSYSADRIGMGQPVRKPFEWKGGLWVCVGKRYNSGDISAEAYRLVHPQMFDGAQFTYAERVRNGDAARADVSGFYHGMRVKHAGGEFVLCGPPVTFAPGESEQLSLF